MKNRIIFLAALGLAWVSAGARTYAATPAAQSVPAVVAASSISVAGFYPVEKMRDPFMRVIPGVGVKSDIPEEFSIHALTLKGLLKDSLMDYAVFNDSSGETFILRKGRLFDQKKNEVQGVSGTVDIRQKMVSLVTKDKDVQIFRLGQKDEEEDEVKN